MYIKSWNAEDWYKIPMHKMKKYTKNHMGVHISYWKGRSLLWEKIIQSLSNILWSRNRAAFGRREGE